MDLQTQHATARFHYHTNPEVGEGIEKLGERAAQAAVGSDDREQPPHWETRWKFLCLCAEEFYIVGEVVAVPRERGLPLLVYPGEVGVILKPFDPRPILSWKREGEAPMTLPAGTLYLRRPSSPFDLRGVPLIQSDGTFAASGDYEVDLFAQQAEALVQQVFAADLGPEEQPDEVPPEDEDTGEEPKKTGTEG